MIPSDPYILLSFINMKLRDEYPDLTDLCTSLDIDEKALKEKLGKIDYEYDRAINAFISR